MGEPSPVLTTGVSLLKVHIPEVGDAVSVGYHGPALHLGLTHFSCSEVFKVVRPCRSAKKKCRSQWRNEMQST